MIRFPLAACALLGLAFALPRSLLPIAPVIAVGMLTWLDRRLLRDLRRPGLWLLLAVLMVLPPLAIAPRDATLWRVPYNAPLLWEGLAMVCRGSTVTVALLLLGRGVSPASIQRAFARLGLRQVGLAVAVALDLLPVTRRAFLRTTLALRLRGGLGRRLPYNLGRLVVAVLVQTVRLSEHVAEALLLRRAHRRRPLRSAIGEGAGKPTSDPQDLDLPSPNRVDRDPHR